MEEFDLYSHFTFQRTGTSTVPAPDDAFLYPLGSYESYSITDPDCQSNCDEPGYQDCLWDCTEFFPGTATLKINILFADGNESGKLRRPFMIVDGFDPARSDLQSECICYI